jgi:signal transduction histidine kinase
VKDSGSGIDSDIIPRLFDKFASKSYQGTGLGLVISKKIIEANGGKIENNRDQKGAIFYSSLPQIW